MKRYLYYFIVFVFIFKVLITNISLTIKSYHEFYETEMNERWQIFEQINYSFIHNIWQYTGFDTGYGFFAPNVASGMKLEHNVLVEETRVTAESDIKLTSKEGKLRFLGLNQSFLDKIDFDTSDTTDEDDKTRNDYLDIIANMICKKNLSGLDTSIRKSAHTILYLVKTPSLKEIARDSLHKTNTVWIAIDSIQPKNLK